MNKTTFIMEVGFSTIHQWTQVYIGYQADRPHYQLWNLKENCDLVPIPLGHGSLLPER